MARAGRRLGLLLAALVVLILGTTLALRLYSSHRLERATKRFEAVAGSLDLSDYAPAPVKNRRENAALWLRAGADALLFDDEQQALLDRRVAAIGEAWPEADAQAFAALLADHDPARRLMDRAAGLERSSFEIEYGRGAEAAIPDFLALLRAARLLGVECDYRLQRGETAAALAALHLLERLTASQRGESPLIAMLAGAASERMYLDRLEAMLQATTDADTVLALRRDFAHLDAATVPPQRPFAADTAAVIPWVLRNAGDWPGVEPEPAEGRVPPALRPFLRALGLENATAAALLETGVRAVESVDVPAARIDPERYRREVEEPRSPIPFAARSARELAPNYLDAVKREQWTRSAHALGRLAVDLRLSRIGHGAYPQAPADLPVSAATGETATYRVLDDGSIELAFPETESSWEDEKKAQAGQTGKITTADVNLRWRLPA